MERVPMNGGRVSVGHPVDVGSGAVFTLSTDFRIPGSLELRWRRHYSTAATSDTWLGAKWMVPYFMTLERRSDQYVLHGAHGEEVTFAAATGRLRLGAVQANLTANMELRREAHHYSVLHWHYDGDINRFYFQAGDGNRLPLAWIENLAGHQIRLEYDTLGRPVLIVQELEKRSIEIAYDRNSLISAIYFVGSTGQKLMVRYEYDGHRRLVTALDAMGYRKKYEYDRENRMIGETNPLGSRFVFEYDRLGRCIRTAGDDGFMERKLVYMKAPRSTRVTDSVGAVTEYLLNQAGQVIQIVNPAGAVTTSTFDEHGRLIGVDHSDGSKQSHAYDDKGNRVQSVDTCGATTTVKHNELHVPIELVDRNGNAWKLPNKHEVSLTGLENLPRRVWDYDRDSRGLVTRARSLGGWLIHVRRDDRFRWQETHDQISLMARTEFDELGHATEVFDAKGSVSRTTYNELHRPIEVRLGASELTRYEWNAIGKKTKRIGPGNEYETWEYDKYGNLVAQTDSLGGTVRFEYDNEGRLTAIVNRVGERLQYRRDTQGRITEEILFDGRTQKYEYDLYDRRVIIHLSDGRTVKQEFDANGRLLCRVASDDLMEKFAYDKEGRVVKAWSNHAVVEIQRDRFGRIVCELQNGRPVWYRYDAEGNRVSRSLPFAASGCKLKRVFDIRGRLVALEDEHGGCQEFAWDIVNRPVERRCPGGVIERFLYDNERRLHQHQVETADGREIHTNAYDASDNLIALEDSRNGTTRYTYDGLSRLKEVRKQLILAEAYEYDANQSLLQSHRGPRAVAPGGKVLQDGHREICYGEDGAVAAIQSGVSTWSLKHDVNGRLVELLLPDATLVRYEYDPFGRRTAKVIGNKRTEFLWEGWALAAEIKGETAETVYVSADLRPLAQWTKAERFTPIVDHRGAVRKIFDGSGEQRWASALDAYGNMLSETGDVPNPFRLRGQYFDAETGLHYNFHRHYDPAIGDYTSPDPIGVTGGYHFYAYPRNPLRWDDPFGLECRPGHEGPPEEDEPNKDKPQKGPPALADPPEEPPPGKPLGKGDGGDEQTPKRRAQTGDDITLSSEEEALKEALKRHGAADPELYEKKDVYGKNDNLKGPNGEPYEKVVTLDKDGNVVEIDHHKYGHNFEDDGTYEYPHYHGPNGEHISYPPE